MKISKKVLNTEFAGSSQSVNYGLVPGTRINEMRYMCDFGPTQFEEVRRAIAYIVDRDEINKQLTGGYRDNGVDLARLKTQEMRFLRKDMQMIFQDPYSSLNPRMTVGQIIGEGLLAHGIFKKNAGVCHGSHGKMWTCTIHDPSLSTSVLWRTETENRYCTCTCIETKICSLR